MASSTSTVSLSEKLPDFKRATDYSGDYPARLWISTLECDFENVGYDENESPVPPPLFLRAVEVLFFRDVEIKMLADPWVQRILNN